MAQFNQSRGAFEAKDYERLKALLMKSINGYDYDSGWITKPTSGSVEINLTALPRYVVVYESNDSTGNGYNSSTISSVTASTVTFSAAKSYVRILANL
jgi:hypothetical protein